MYLKVEKNNLQVEDGPTNNLQVEDGPTLWMEDQDQDLEVVN